MIWHALNRAVRCPEFAAVSRNFRNSSKNSSETEESFSSRFAAKADTNRTVRSDETVRLAKSKRGVRALTKEEGKREREDTEDRMDESSLSFRAWIACERRHSSKILTILFARLVESSETASSGIPADLGSGFG